MYRGGDQQHLEAVGAKSREALQTALDCTALIDGGGVIEDRILWSSGMPPGPTPVSGNDDGYSAHCCPLSRVRGAGKAG